MRQRLFNINTVHLANDMDWIKGRHQIGFGVDYMRTQFNSINIWNSNGNFSFNGQYASGKTMNDALAAFMLGVRNTYCLPQRSESRQISGSHGICKPGRGNIREPREEYSVWTGLPRLRRCPQPHVPLR
jgi:hypothetical protein